MKTSDYLLVPLLAICLLFFEIFTPLSMGVVIVILSVASVYQLFIIQKRLTLDFSRQEKSFLHQIEGTKKDKHLMASQLDTVFTNIPSPLALMDTYGNLVLINQSFRRFLNKNGDKLDYNSENIDFGIRKFIKESYLTEKALIRNVDYQGIDFQCLSVPISENDRYAGCLLIFQDITQAVEKERMQKRFIADASHELKTPISAIKGMIEILNRDGFDDDEILHDFHIQIEKETHRLEEIVSDLLQLSRLSSGQLLLDKTSCDINQIIKNAVDEIQSINHNKIQIKIKGEIEGLIVLDESKIHQVITNLIKNACVHSGADLIEVIAEETDTAIKIKVKDNGCGINQKDLEHIFERFYRVDAHRARKSGGSGLGLSIVKSIMMAHQGDVEVISEVNKGSMFTLTLPKI